ncbi:hypothetical protein AnigIFM62618_002560 [Aspergillus niger]|nr:hypothetical protein AnigIFM62618_002560 [Aspergillus niger]
MSTTHSLLPDSTSLALTTQYPPRPYRGIQECKRAVLSLWDDLYPQTSNTVDQYLTYKDVTPASFHSLFRLRHRLQRIVRFTYFPTISTLLIKVLTPASEKAYLLFIYGTVTNLTNMGTELVEQEFFIRSALYKATALAPGSQKEADTGLKNGLLRPDDATDWPQLVIESGVSGSLHRLRQDVNWWIGCSEGMVLLVLLLVVDCGQRRLIIEKYFPQQLRQGGGGGPVTRAQAAHGRMDDGFVPQLIATTIVDMRADPPAVEGPPVVLEFERVVGRRPVGPAERDIVWGPSDLVEIGGIVLRWIP